MLPFRGGGTEIIASDIAKLVQSICVVREPIPGDLSDLQVSRAEGRQSPRFVGFIITKIPRNRYVNFFSSPLARNFKLTIFRPYQHEEGVYHILQIPLG